MLHPKEKERVERLRLNRESYSMISKITKLPYFEIKMHCIKQGLDSDTIKSKPPPKVGKYDYLFDEPVSVGKNYKEYKRDEELKKERALIYRDINKSRTEALHQDDKKRVVELEEILKDTEHWGL